MDVGGNASRTSTATAMSVVGRVCGGVVVLMSNSDGEESSMDTQREPEWDESPVTLNIIQMLTEAHPDYRYTSHISPKGNRYVMLEFPESGEFEGEAAGDFVSLVSELGEDDDE